MKKIFIFILTLLFCVVGVHATITQDDFIMCIDTTTGSGSSLTDQINNIHNGIIEGSYSWVTSGVPSVYGSAISVNGSGKIKIDDGIYNGTLNPNGVDRTILWVGKYSAGDQKRLWHKATGSTGSAPGFQMWTETSGYLSYHDGSQYTGSTSQANSYKSVWTVIDQTTTQTDVYIDNSASAYLTDSGGTNINPNWNMYLLATVQSAGSLTGEFTMFAVFNRTLTQEERDDFYNSGEFRNCSYYTEVTEKTYEKNAITKQPGIITLTTSNFTPVISLSINITNNNTLDYGSTSLNLISTANNSITCKTIVDGNDDNISITNRTNIAGIIGSMYILRQNITLDIGIHNISVECAKFGLGNISVSQIAGITHILLDEENKTLNYRFVSGENTTTSPTNFEKIAVGNFTTREGKEGFNKYLVLDGKTIYTNNHNTDENISARVGIISNSETQYCLPGEIQYPVFVVSNSTGVMAETCIFNVSANTNYTTFLEIKGTNATINFIGHWKEFDLTSDNINELAMNGTDISSSTFTKIAEIQINNTDITPGQIFIKTGIPIISNSGSTNGNVQIRISGDITYQGFDTLINITNNPQTQIINDVVNVPTGAFNVELWAKCDNSDCSIVGGDFSVYMSEEYEKIDTSFLARAFNHWNNSIINDFTVELDDGTTISSVNGNATIFTSLPFSNLLFRSNDYIDRTIINHNTSNNINTTLYQSVLYLSSSEIYTNNLINNFSVETDQGIFNTNNGSITLYPNIANYLWNFTFDTYFNQSNISLNITNTENNFILTNVIDSIFTFFSENNTALYPVCSWIGNILNLTYEIAAQTSVGGITCELPEYVTFSIPINETPYFYKNFTMLDARIVLNLYDDTTRQLITNETFNLELSGDVGYYFNFSDNPFNISDGIIADNYLGLISSDNYETKEIYFSYSASEIKQLDLYFIPLNYTDLGFVTIQAYQSNGEPYKNIAAYAKQFFSETSTFEKVQETRTGNDGQAEIKIILESRLYKFCIYTEENGETCTGDERITITENGKIIPIIEEVRISTSPTLFQDLNFQENIQLVQSENTKDRNLSVSFSWVDLTGFNLQVCYKLIKDYNFTQQTLINNCILGSATEFQQIYVLNSSYAYIFQVDAVIDGETVSLYSNRFAANEVDANIDNVLEEKGLTALALVLYIIIIMVIIALLKQPFYVVLVVFIAVLGVNTLFNGLMSAPALTGIMIFCGMTAWGLRRII